MANTTLPQKKKLIHSAISMGCILCVLVFCIVLLPTFSFSWFSKNENAEGSDMGVSAQNYPLKIEYSRCDEQTLTPGEFTDITQNSSLNFLESDVWYPGYSAVFALRITNVGRGDLCVDTVGFCAPTESEEKALVVDEQSYFLGTQLSVAVLSINGAPQNTPPEQRLLTLSDGEPNRAALTIYDDTEQTLTLDPSESILLTVRLIFVNEDFSQDVYRDFGKDQDATECCRRRLFVTYIDVE